MSSGRIVFLRHNPKTSKHTTRIANVTPTPAQIETFFGHKLYSAGINRQSPTKYVFIRKIIVPASEVTKHKLDKTLGTGSDNRNIYVAYLGWNGNSRDAICKEVSDLVNWYRIKMNDTAGRIRGSVILLEGYDVSKLQSCINATESWITSNTHLRAERRRYGRYW